jgi:hypothetical protein
MRGDPLVVGLNATRDRLCLTLRAVADVRAGVSRPGVRVVDVRAVRLGAAMGSSWFGHEASSFSMGRSLRTPPAGVVLSRCSGCTDFAECGHAADEATAPLQGNPGTTGFDRPPR